MVTCPSTNLAIRLRIPGAGFDLAREPPAILVHVLLGERVVSHVQPIDAP